MTSDASEQGVERYLAKFRRARNAWWPRYIFIHINKTAGSSIERALGLRFEHMTARQKRLQVGPRHWQGAFKFAFVRNPWARALSHYRYRVQTNQTGLGDEHLTFRDWIRAVFEDMDPRYRDQEQMFQNQWQWLCDDSGACLVDFIGRFESLQSDFSSVCRILGVSHSLPHVKRSTCAPLADAYDLRTKDIVAQHFAIDIKMLGYKFQE